MTFVSKSQLESKLQPPLLLQSPSLERLSGISGNNPSFAIIQAEGTPRSIRSNLFFRVREATNILASTSAFYGKRSHPVGFSVKGYPFYTQRFDNFVQVDGTNFHREFSQDGKIHPFVLDSKWHQAISQTGIIDLFDRIKDKSLAADWRRQIGSGAAMLGKSLMSLELADAFLMNVFGLETLLTTYRQRNGDMLTRRIKGITGWYLKTHRPHYQTEISNIHHARCNIVHDSDYSSLTNTLLLLSDAYLANCLLNIVRFPHIFPDKATLMSTLDGYANAGNWPTDGSLPLLWVGSTTFSHEDLKLPLF